ncbi:MAG TPA: hypothetical protein VGC09_14845 [Rhodopila sp.]
METAEHLDFASSVVGYLGAGIVILGYLLNQKGSLSSEDWRYPAMNLLGSVLVMVSLVFHLNPPSVVIEIFWSSISIYGIRRNLRAARRYGS